MKINNMFYIESFKCYLYIIRNKRFSYQRYLELFELEKNDANNRKYKRIVRFIKDAMNELRLGYLLIFDYHIQGYKLIDVSIANFNVVKTDERYAYIRTYNFLKTNNYINRNTLSKLLSVEKHIVSKMIKNIAISLFDLNIDEMIKFNYHTDTYEIIYDEPDDDYLDYIYGADW